MPRLLRDLVPPSLKDNRELFLFLLLAASVASALVSIAISQIFLAVMLAAVFWGRIQDGLSGFALPSFAWPLFAFLAWTVFAALASPDPLLDLTITKKFFIFLLLLVVPGIARGGGRVIWIYHTIFFLAGVSGALGVGQYIANPERDLLHRISGFMSQWMTYSGLQMLSIVSLTAYAVTYGWRRVWILPLALLLGGSLLLTFTRSAWLGTLGGAAVVLVLKRPRAILGLACLLVLLWLIAPGSAKGRISAGLDPDDPTTRGRIELAQTSIRLILDNPWLGVGPKSVNTEALRYRSSFEFPDWLYQHMHNNFLQIAAERGIPGLIFWLWLIGKLGWDSMRRFQSIEHGEIDSEEKAQIVACTAAMGAWVALLVMGMFEYNFGDSEVLTLFLFMMSAPYAVQKEPN